MIKCIAIDMDGTLLNAEQILTKENETAIKQAQDEGIEVVIATGRSYQEAGFILEEAGISCPILCVNGAEIRSCAGKVLSSNPLSKEAAKKAALKLIENDVYFEVYTNKGTYTSDEDKALSVIADIFKSANPEKDLEQIYLAAEERFHKGLIQKVDNYDELFNGNEHEIYKLLAFSLEPGCLEAAKAALGQIGELAISSSGHENLEITNHKAQKGIALETFVKERGILLQETMAIGDNYNDISMFKIVGRAVAMGNADEKIKAECHFTTATNEESGVGKAIAEILKQPAAIKN